MKRVFGRHEEAYTRVYLRRVIGRHIPGYTLGERFSGALYTRVYTLGERLSGTLLASQDPKKRGSREPF